jgi:two-component system, chemotaxis family, sensor kinase CheA
MDRDYLYVRAKIPKALTMDSSLNRFRDKFYEEANQLLDKVEKDLLELEKMPDTNELIESAFRAMHTIKGVSGMFGFDFVCEFTHSMESVFQLIRDKEIVFNQEIFDLTFSSIDHIRKLIADEKLADKENQSRHNKLIQDITIILERSKAGVAVSAPADYEILEPTNPVQINTWHILLCTDEKLYFRGISLIGIFAELSKLGSYRIVYLDYLSSPQSDTWSIFLSSNASKSDISDIFMFIDDNVTIVQISNQDIFEHAVQDGGEESISTYESELSILDYIEKGKEPMEPVKKEEANVKSPAKDNGTVTPAYKQAIKRISVDSVKLDNLMFLVSELITVNSQLLLATHGEQFTVLKPIVERVDGLSKLFRNNAFEIRLVPLSDTVLRFQRLIRDLSRQLGKKIELVTQGTDTELDKNTIDHLNEPLMHIIRNCIDHGIEEPEARVKAGKTETGIIRISASQSGNYIIIVVEDDGVGINMEKVRLKGVEKGLLKASDKPTRQDIFDLIFLPGFSTAESLSEVSGRGVGMDVVRKKITDLRGDIMISSQEGKGTAFTLKLQQSVAIIDSLLFTVEDSFFTVPLSDIMVCSQILAEEIAQRRHTGTLPFNNELIPFVDLRKKLNIKGSYTRKVKVIIIRNNDQLIALLTDKIVGEHQAVLKPLGRSFHNQECISSASQLGDGNLAFMIDSYKLFSAYDLANNNTTVTG